MTTSSTTMLDAPAFVEEEWVEGTAHPTGGYDCVREDEENGVTMTEYRRDRLLHREDGPAHEYHFEDGSRSESFYRNGELYRAVGPVVIEYSQSGMVFSEVYAVGSGTPTRLDGPARIAVDEETGLRAEEWFLDGVRHRLDGPAVVVPPVFGEGYVEGFLASVPVKTEGYHYEWWVHGANFTYSEYVRLAEALASDAPLEWAIAYSRGENP